MSTDFSFKEFVKDVGLKPESIQILTEACVDTERACSLLTPARIANLQLKEGESMCLEAVCKERWPHNFGLATVKTEPEIGAVGGAEAGATNRGETTADNGSSEVIKTTTKTLAKDPEVDKLLKGFLGISETLGGLKDLLALSDIKSSVEAKTKGEKPLLIADFLSSNINVSYIDNPEEEVISKSVKLVREGKTKRPSVQDYTPEVWAGANFRALKELVTNGASKETLLQYITYSSNICDYLCMYNQPGVFLLDHEHRHRVALEGRVWDDILRHDELRYLVHVSDPASTSSKTAKKAEGEKSQA